MNERHSTHESWVEPTPGGRTIDEQFLIVKKVPKNKFDVDRSEISIPMENVRKAVDGYWARPDIRAEWLRSYPHDRELTHLPVEKRLHLSQLLWGVNLRVQDSADNWHTLSLTPDDREKLLTILYPKDGSPKNAFRRMDRRAGLKLSQFSGRGAIEVVENVQKAPLRIARRLSGLVDSIFAGGGKKEQVDHGWDDLLEEIDIVLDSPPATPESLMQSETELELDPNSPKNIQFMMSPDTCRRVISISTTDGRQLNGFIYTTRTPILEGKNFFREIHFIITDGNVSTVLDAVSSPKGNDARPIDVLLAETFGYIKKEFNGDTYAPYEGDGLKQQIKRFFRVPAPPTQQEMEPISIETEELRSQTEVELDSDKTRQELFLESPDHCRQVIKIDTEKYGTLYGFVFTTHLTYQDKTQLRLVSIHITDEKVKTIYHGPVLKISPETTMDDATKVAINFIKTSYGITRHTAVPNDQTASLIDRFKVAEPFDPPSPKPQPQG